MNYRADIDGLRALAVLSVVIFHLDISGFEGGYVGVDIFFVISGYLITSIIIRNYEDGKFQLPAFYARRIRRLVPPLIATVAASLLGAAFLMTPDDMAAMSRSAAAALFSVSNFVFYAESGYWDTASELKPLLHTWSLGVEEQFYLFWPSLIIGMLSVRRVIAFGTSLALLALLGAALCVWYTSVDQSAAFYLLPFRVFQFALGAWLITLLNRINAFRGACPRYLPTLAFWPGLLGIAISVVAFDDGTTFPGWAVILPTVGAALVLASGALPGRLDPAARVLMQNPLSTWLGRVSYSMYLVHWPLIVLFRYRYGLELSAPDQLLLAIATLLATCALHYGIERRFYSRSMQTTSGDGKAPNRRFLLHTATAAGLVALVASSAWLGNGWAWRFTALALSPEAITQGMQDRFQLLAGACLLQSLLSSKDCKLDADVQVLVLGNSVEVDGYNFIRTAYGDDPDVNIILFGNANQCKKVRYRSGRLVTDDETCREMLDALFDPAMLSRLDIVVYAANQPYAVNKKNFLHIFRGLLAANPRIRLVTFGGYINTRRPCSYYINRANSTDACALPENVRYFADSPEDEPLNKAFRELEAFYIDRVSLLCENRALETCRTRTDAGVPAMYDDVHSSLEFAQMSGQMYAAKYPHLLHDLASGNAASADNR